MSNKLSVGIKEYITKAKKVTFMVRNGSRDLGPLHMQRPKIYQKKAEYEQKRVSHFLSLNFFLELKD